MGEGHEEEIENVRRWRERERIKDERDDIYIYIYIYIYIDRQTDKRIDRQSETERQRCIERKGKIEGG